MEHVARRGEQAEGRAVGPPSTAVEDSFTRSLEEYGAGCSSAYLAVALGAMGLSRLFQVTGRGKWGNFVAQWVPTWILFGVYNKLVKLEAHREDGGGRVSRSSTRTIMASEHQTHDYYMTVGPTFSDPIARQL